MQQSIQEWTKWNFLNAVFRKFYLDHSWILWPIFAEGSYGTFVVFSDVVDPFMKEADII